MKGGLADVNKYKTFDVRLTLHATERIRERLPGIKLSLVCGRLKQRIRTELRKGIPVNPYGCVEIEIRPGIWAVCAPSLMGGYEVITIIAEESEETDENHLPLRTYEQCCPS